MDSRSSAAQPTRRWRPQLLTSSASSLVPAPSIGFPAAEWVSSVPTDSVTAVPTLCRALCDWLPADVVVVSPDGGRVGMATQYAQCLGAPVIVLHKRRESGSETKVTHIIGDVSGRAC